MPRRPPEMSIASSGAGTRYPSIVSLSRARNFSGTWDDGGLAERVGPFHNIDRTPAPVVGDEDGGAYRQGRLRPGDEIFCTAADSYPDLTRAGLATGGDGDHAYRANRGFVASHNTAAPVVGSPEHSLV